MPDDNEKDFGTIADNLPRNSGSRNVRIDPDCSAGPADQQPSGDLEFGFYVDVPRIGPADFNFTHKIGKETKAP